VSLKLAVDEASFGLKQVALLFDCAPARTSSDIPSSPFPASSLSPMSSVIHGDAAWSTAVHTVQVGCVQWLITQSEAQVMVVGAVCLSVC